MPGGEEKSPQSVGNPAVPLELHFWIERLEQFSYLMSSFYTTYISLTFPSYVNVKNEQTKNQIASWNFASFLVLGFLHMSKPKIIIRAFESAMEVRFKSFFQFQGQRAIFSYLYRLDSYKSICIRINS